MFDDDDRARDWAGGGGWQDPDPPPPDSPKKAPSPPAPPAKPAPKVPLKPYREKSTRGLVAGRFLPLHLGHEHLIGTAKRSSEELHVVVFESKGDPISGERRAEWLREAFPGVSAYVAAESSDFASAIRKATGRMGYDTFYAGEIAEGNAAAKAIGATFVPIDPDRSAFPISGTTIRQDVMASFNQIATVARPSFVRRVAVLGPPSTGKTTLCRNLAEIYSTRFVPEPARALAQASGGTIDEDALQLWMRTQRASEDTVARYASRVLFCDTDPLTVILWSWRLVGAVADGMQTRALHRDYDLVILCNYEVPFVGAPERDDPTARVDLFNALANGSSKGPRVVLAGTNWEQRTLAARKAVDQLLSGKALLPKRVSAG